VDAASGRQKAPDSRPAERSNGNVAMLSARQREIVAAFGGDSASVDTLVDRTSLAPQVVLQELTFLSLKGLVRRVDGQTYATRA
jgi:predicted Rossmann fold nucleotide-binding protein DprA/Smf involved in DNA uptake